MKRTLQVALWESGNFNPIWRGSLVDFCRDNEMDFDETLAQFCGGDITSACKFIRIGGGAAPEFRLSAINF